MIQKLTTLLFILCLTLSVQAQKKPGFSKEEFRAKQEAYLTQKAELTAEEATKILGEICCESRCYNGCPIGKARGKMSCHFFRRDKTEEVLEILKQWKKNHEKKPIKTESVGIVRVIEGTGDIKKCVYEEELTERENQMDAKERVLKEYCQKHDGKFLQYLKASAG